MMGTGPFAVPTFRAFAKIAISVLGLVTRPERPVHSREKSPVNPMRAVAEEAGLDVFAPESINSPEAHAWLREKSADLFVVCDYGQILSRETLALSRLGGINLHASLLPKYRGAAPINWAIYHGETETGVTVIHMTPQLDAGPSLVQRSTADRARRNRTAIGSAVGPIGRRRSDRSHRALGRRHIRRGHCAESSGGHESAAAEKTRRPDRLVAFRSTNLQPNSRVPALAEKLHVSQTRRLAGNAAHRGTLHNSSTRTLHRRSMFRVKPLAKSSPPKAKT